MLNDLSTQIEDVLSRSLCEQCSKAPESFSTEYDFLRRRHVIVVSCHGAYEQFFLEDTIVKSARKIALKPAVFFKRESAFPPEKKLLPEGMDQG